MAGVAYCPMTPLRTPSDKKVLALSPEEAAQALGVSRSTIYRTVLPEIRVVALGRRTLIPVKELEAWLDKRAAAFD